MVQFVDLRAQHDSIRKELFDAIAGVIDSSAFIMGPAIKEFEPKFAQFCGVKHAIGCSSGTSALHLALWALGIGPGDEVITIPHTFIATAEAITMRGAKPVFVDIDPASYTMDVSKVEAAISPRTRAIIPVHLYGHPTDMDPLLEIARKHGLKVIEDCAQSHGAEYKGRRVGAIGDVGCFSFFPGKNMGAMGDAGAVTTNDDAVAARVAKLRNHGREGKYEHEMVGYNDRIDNLQAAILNVKLPHLNDWNARRREHAAQYCEELAGVDIGLPTVAPGCVHVYHLFVIEHPKRDDLQKSLKEEGIATGVHYPLPLHLQPAYADLGYAEGDFPATEAAAKRILSLPMYPEMTREMVTEVTDAIKEFLGAGTIAKGGESDAGTAVKGGKSGESVFKGARICMLAPFPPRKGGVAVQTALVVKGLEAEGAEVFKADTNLQFLRFGTLGTPIRLALQPWVTLFRLLRALPKCDILNIQAAVNWGFMPAILGVPLGNLYKKRVVLMFHSGIGPRFLDRFPWLAKTPFRRATVSAVCSRQLQDAFKERGIEAMLFYNLFEPDLFIFRERPKIEPKIIWTRWLEPLYDPMSALRAFRIVKQRYPNAEMVLAGNGSMLSSLRGYVKREKIDGVTVPGRVSPEEVARLMNEADICLNTSRADGMPTALLEAGACGLPIVTTNVGGIASLFEDGVSAMLREPDDPEALAQAMLDLLDNPDRAKEMGAKAREVVMDYTWPKASAAIAKAYGLKD